nr:hypothetical protein [uncultured Clostridium sp.]
MMDIDLSTIFWKKNKIQKKLKFTGFWKVVKRRNNSPEMGGTGRYINVPAGLSMKNKKSMLKGWGSFTNISIPWNYDISLTSR